MDPGAPSLERPYDAAAFTLLLQGRKKERLPADPIQAFIISPAFKREGLADAVDLVVMRRLREGQKTPSPARLGTGPGKRDAAGGDFLPFAHKAARPSAVDRQHS